MLHSLTGTMAWTESPVVDATLLATASGTRFGEGFSPPPIEQPVITERLVALAPAARLEAVSFPNPFTR
jgi:hypothetical protein